MSADRTLTLDDQLRHVAGLTADSRQVRPGYLFAALPGTRADGTTFIAEAVRRGASTLLVPHGAANEAIPPGVTVIEDENPRRRLAMMAARFFERQPRTICAITGTNGKTSVADFTRQLWQLLGHDAGSLGTLGVVGPGFAHPTGLTTPDPITLYRSLARMAAHGIDHVAIEASSHGLAQYRLDAVKLAAAAFTNFTRDHLDYHGSVKEYRRAKLRLFYEVLPTGRPVLLNADDPTSELIAMACRRRGHDVITYGQGGVWLRLEEVMPEAHAQMLRLKVFGRTHAVRLPLIGTFQAMNALCAAGLVIATGAEPNAVVPLLEQLQGVPGRLQLAATTPAGAPVIVDYAHTPDALSTAISALRPHTPGRIVVVFGCGGDRDRGKRPLMGAAVARLADVAIVTDDNPRSENPAAIRRAVMAACPGAQEIGDRRAAIAAGIAALRAGDALLVAGKGHEPGQIVRDQVLPFDDLLVSRELVAELSGEAA